MPYVISRNNLIKGEEVWAPPCTNCVCGYHFQPGNHNLYFHDLKACAFNLDSSCGFIRPRNAKAGALQAILSSSSTNCVKTKSGAIIMLITKIFCECRQSVAIKGKVIANQCSGSAKCRERGKQAQRPDFHGLIKKKKNTSFKNIDHI